MRRFLIPSLAMSIAVFAYGQALEADDAPQDKSEAAPAKKAAVSEETQKAIEQSSLAEEVAREHLLLWQKAVATYKAAEKRIRIAVVKTDFAAARRMMDFAQQTIELNRRYATPASDYTAYIKRAKALEAFIAEEQRVHDEEAVKLQQDAIKKRRAEQIRLAKQAKQRQVDNLMERAAALRKDMKLGEAIQVLDQVLAIDPNNGEAAWMRETLEDLSQNRRDLQAVRDRQRESQDVFIENDEAGVPYHDDIRYPDNWLEISAKRLGVAAVTESPENQEVRRKLGRVAPEIKFDALPFEEVIDKLRAFTGLNIVPNWAALEAAAIEKDAEVSLRLSNVSFEKALELILDHVGAGEVELGYEIDEGVIQISTKEDLSRRTLTAVYNIKDLLVSVPTFKAPGLEITNIGQDSGNQEGGIGGGRFIEGGGGGGGGGNNNFLDDDDDDDDEDDGDQEDAITQIIYLIMQTIDPESWREAGGNVGTIASLNQQLIVTQTATAHAQLRDLLRESE